ncbi:MAG TPA: DUF1989 domain-containing protein [Burkholderiales bacterium]|nr:DUF1989 domain-containing protein [Burkholderiales bacterium]
MKNTVEIPARRGAAVTLKAGQTITVVNTHGGQVVDFWAFRVDGSGEHLSMPHSAVTIGRVKPAVGDVLVSDLRRHDGAADPRRVARRALHAVRGVRSRALSPPRLHRASRQLRR